LKNNASKKDFMSPTATRSYGRTFPPSPNSSRGLRVGCIPRRFAPCLSGRLMPPARRVYTHDTELEVLTGVTEFKRDAGGWPIARNNGGDFYTA
jgi:hypothetical protein